ncbi:serine/threonine protein kinase, CMGC, dual-specificity [Stygiomarasmius scandens]|uniref:dual-specificity kinase n=1 Tax=Marasmiellus scandens TaxID=2682957 RepID=A0ABR1JTM8_9AGAR
MSAPPSPRHPHKKRDRPPALDIHDRPTHPASDTDIVYKRDQGPQLQPDVRVQSPPAHQETPVDSDTPASRPASATSSLDPYYFGISSPSDSPLPPLPPSNALTPDPPYSHEPITPAKDPSSIDRRGLVGVGELATPRWARHEHSTGKTHDVERDDHAVEVVAEAEEEVDDVPDSPWTIEAVDGEMSEKDDLMEVKSVPKSLRARPSMTEESGGEEILYPRQANSIAAGAAKHPMPEALTIAQTDSSSSEPNVAVSPPSSFTLPHRRAKKRTSDEFEMDQTGSLVSKRASSMSSKERPQEDVKPYSRRHRSLNAGSISGSIAREGKGKERRRESVGLSLSGTPKSEKHARHASASSPSSAHVDALHNRRVPTADFSHLPPSPSTSSIQQFLRGPGNLSSPNTPPLTSPSKEPTSVHHSPNVAHSLLRGTQEGWSGLDDEATAEALRKLDGLSGKTARARASVGSLGRPASSSRPGTPAKSGSQWEGVGEGGKLGRRASGHKDTASSVKEKEPVQRQAIGLGILGPGADTEFGGSAISSDEQSPYSVSSSAVDKTPRKTGPSSARSSFTPKRGSTSSTTNGSTPTTSSRDSISAATSVTSVSGTSGRQSSGKARRNSASSDVSSVVSGDATSLKDRVASLAVSGDASEETAVPPVPPLPKDLSTYRSPPSTAIGVSFPNSDEKPRSSHDSDRLEVPSVDSGSSNKQDRRRSQHASVNYTSASDSGPSVNKTPSKKWSFSNALSLKLTGSPSSSSKHSGYPVSPRSVTVNQQQIRKSTSKDQALSPSSASSSKSPWSPAQQPEAMSSAASLASLSSVGSVRTSAQPSTSATPLSKTPDRVTVPSRSGTDSSASTNHTFAGLSAPPVNSSGPLSPTSSVRRHQSKRLTPSSIPFFRRSSSQSMQLPPSGAVSSSPPTSGEIRTKQSTSPSHDYNLPSTSTPGSAQKKSVLSLGLPSLLKGSSSRKSLHSDSKEAVKDAQKARDAAKEAEKEKEKEKLRKEEKDRSESRISALMGRKRGKTLSSTEPRKPKSPVHMPPMQISALEPATAQRVARLKASGSSSTTTSTPSASSAPSMARATSASRATQQTASSMQKQSDTSLRSRNQLPTIAGSPSVGTVTQTSKENKEPPPSSLMNSVVGHPKETPTKIPRISSRTSTVSSPPLKTSNSIAARRTSVNVSGLSSSANPSPTGLSTNEFGVIEDGNTPKTTARTTPARASPTNPATSTSRVPRQVSNSGSIIPRKSNRESISFAGLRKSSTGSVTNAAASTANDSSTSHHRFSALSPSKGLKLLNPKISLSSARSSHTASSQSLAQAAATPSSSRQSLTTPSPVPSSVDDEEVMGDEEMMQYIKRQHAKKLQNGATQEELDELLRFPEPLPPGTPLSPSAVLKSNQNQYLCDYERKEILDYQHVYYIGARSKKNFATLDNSTNNYGYDDDRGDYQVVNHDHLAFRYEVIDTLGKGSFGQVLHCRDHCTGESVAIKIIRNKKRFHHQALVEIKILDNLRKWDADEKHHVIKMTEHFYFRNHLCIAMELLSINLYELIKANGFVGFTTALIRRFTSQMLLSLSLMRHHRIVHCDLKPENVLLRHPAKSAIKVIDFGSSCFEHEKIYTYIQSRFYRSPEVILGMNYHMAIDMWSLGCILAELYTGFPIFPGENEQEQLSCIMEVLGIPDKDFVNRSSRKKLFFEPNGTPRAVINSKGRRRRPGTKTLAQVLRCNDEDFIDFIAKCLVWDPEKRIKPQAAMRHPFITAGRRPKLPPSTSKSTLSSSTLNSRKKSDVTETPKKSLISAPTPLTARSTRTTGNGVPTTPSSSTHNTTLSSTSRSYRSSQAHSLSSHHSNRTLNGYMATAAK